MSASTTQRSVDRIGELDVAYVPGRHYVPAWGTALSAPDGTRIVYAGDTGPNPELAGLASGADLMICEATLGSVDEDDEAARGHLTLEEALEHGRAARAARLLITHYPSARREAMSARLAGLDGTVTLARPGLTVDVGLDDGRADVEAAGGPMSSTDPIPFAARRAVGDR